LNSPDAPLLWAPYPGRQRLSLTDASEREMDVVRFEVRFVPGEVRADRAGWFNDSVRLRPWPPDQWLPECLERPVPSRFASCPRLHSNAR
jgi:hypothetical protein